MKKITKVFALAAALTLSATLASQAQIVVRVRPNRPHVVYHRPPAPSPRHVWVEEDWAPRGRGYAWHGGHWEAPPRERAVYVPGRWEKRGHGQVWIAATWR
ncbi:YXWGXW repeat-containing protein [Mucilaginibacter sp. HMF5004]|uniref:YXWGXW repeat-containing protein n=1 Tax=Mucilaginibacter rivuli TaxID=2857527 RepID=UPI001C5F71CB|nr:YXWGXW repeat-containing protein [Mucilaginibacter rivuli]MBW4890794.1 YXWGXW repeat-containing protein [Mucilaginibacter rivuli]